MKIWANSNDDVVSTTENVHRFCVTTSGDYCFEIRENETGDGLTVECVKEVVRIDRISVELR